MSIDKKHILPKMVDVSNNSPLTFEMAELVNEKFTDKERYDFYRWLQIVEQNSLKP